MRVGPVSKVTISQFRHTDHRETIHANSHTQQRESIPCVATTCLYAHDQRLCKLLIKVWILTWEIYPTLPPCA